MGTLLVFVFNCFPFSEVLLEFDFVVFILFDLDSYTMLLLFLSFDTYFLEPFEPAVIPSSYTDQLITPFSGNEALSASALRWVLKDLLCS